jgi:hypothetical protein
VRRYKFQCKCVCSWNVTSEKIPCFSLNYKPLKSQSPFPLVSVWVSAYKSYCPNKKLMLSSQKVSFSNYSGLEERNTSGNGLLGQVIFLTTCRYPEHDWTDSCNKYCSLLAKWLITKERLFRHVYRTQKSIYHGGNG